MLIKSKKRRFVCVQKPLKTMILKRFQTLSLDDIITFAKKHNLPETKRHATKILHISQSLDPFKQDDLVLFFNQILTFLPEEEVTYLHQYLITTINKYDLITLFD